MKDWIKFFKDIHLAENGYELIPIDDENYLWKVFCDCVAGYKAGRWDIPYLDKSELTVADKVVWLQEHNPCSSHTYTKKTWEKASEKSRQSKVFPQEIVQCILNKLNEDDCDMDMMDEQSFDDADILNDVCTDDYVDFDDTDLIDYDFEFSD